MPYAANTDLPTFRAAFNHAFENHRDDPRQEEIAHRSAWSAVKRQY